MSNFHADKARGLLNLAEIERTALNQLRDDARSGEGRPLSYEEQVLILLDASSLVAAAQVHATLATVHENEVFEAPQPEQAEAPKDPGTDEPGESAQDPTEAFLQSVDETLDLLRSLGPVVRLFVAPRPVKDTPQA